MRLARTAAWTAVVLLALVLVAALLAWRLLDERRLRAELETRLSAAIGRPVRVEGPVRVRLGPQTRFEAGGIVVDGTLPAGPPLLAVDSIRGSLRTRSVFGDVLELGRVELGGIRLQLRVDEQGRDNWTLPPAPSAPPGEPPPAWRLAGVRVEDARVEYRDLRSGVDLVVHDWRLELGETTPGQPVPLATRLALAYDGAAQGTLRATGRVRFDASFARWDVESLALDAELARTGGADWPIRLTLAAGEYDAALGTARLRELELGAPGFVARAAGEASALRDEPRLAARFAIEPFDPRRLAARLGTPLPALAGPAALERARIAARAEHAGGWLRLTELDAAVDDTQVTGALAIGFAEALRWRLELALDRLDADRYRPTAADAGRAPAPTPPRSPAAAARAAEDAAAAPLELLRGLDAGGTIRIGELRGAGVRLRDVTLALDAGE